MIVKLRAALCIFAALVFHATIPAHAQTEPEKLWYTGKLECPQGQRIAYFFYSGFRLDLPELRAGSWCGAADASNAYADKIDPAGAPYRTEVCNAPHWFTYSHASPTPADPNRRINGGEVAGTNIWLACYAGPEPTHQVTIRLSGPSSTHALPAGPVLPQSATVTRDGAPAPGKAVSIKIERFDGTAETLLGSTDASGVFRFVYRPPYLRSGTDTLIGNCSDCTNTDTKKITVEACPTCEQR